MSAIKKSIRTKEMWAFALKRKLVADLLNCYGKEFIFKGTLDKSATTNRYDVSKYFKKFVNIANHVTFLKNNQIMVNNNIVFDCGKYNFKTDKGIIKAQYMFVFDKKGKIIAHYSNLYD